MARPFSPVLTPAGPHVRGALSIATEYAALALRGFPEESFGFFAVPGESDVVSQSIKWPHEFLALLRRTPITTESFGATDNLGVTLLMVCSCIGRDDLVRRAVHETGDALPGLLAVTDRGGNTAAHYAARSTNPKCLALLLRAGAAADAANKRGYLPLHEAAACGTEAVAKLIPLSDIDAASTDGWRPLDIAAQFDRRDAAERLLRGGADAGPNVEGRTPLIIAAQHNGHETVAALAEHAARHIEAADGERGRTAVHWACATGHAEALRALLRAGARADTPDARGCTPLITCAKGISIDCMRMILGALPGKADIDVQNAKGWSAMSIAAERGNVPLFELLLEHGAVLDGSGTQPLFAAAQNGHAEIVRRALAAGALVEGNMAQSTPLCAAARRNHVECVLDLIAGGADTGFVCPKGETVIAHAVHGRAVECARILLDLDPSGLAFRRRASRWSLLMIALSRNCTAGMVQLLIEKHREHGSLGAALRAKSTTGNRAVHIAVLSGNVGGLRALLLAGADPDVRNAAGMNALALAYSREKAASVRLLLLHGADSRSPAQGVPPLAHHPINAVSGCIEEHHRFSEFSSRRRCAQVVCRRRDQQEDPPSAKRARGSLADKIAELHPAIKATLLAALR